MTNTFDYILNSADFEQMTLLLKSALEYSETDPHGCLGKIDTIVQDVISKLASDNGIPRSLSLFEKISALKKRHLITDAVDANLFYLRKMRNHYSAHTTETGTGIVIADKTTAIYALKQLYEFLTWFLNHKRIRENFISFEDYIKSETNSTQKVDTTKLDKQKEVLSMPSFQVDREFFQGYSAKKKLAEITNEKEMEVFKRFFTTYESLAKLDDEVLKQNRENGKLSYCIINFKDDRGITREWRNFVVQKGIKESIKIIEKNIPEEDNNHKKQITKLLEILIEVGD